MKKASLDAGLNETFVRDALKRDREPSRRNLERLSTSIGVDFLSAGPPNMVAPGEKIQGMRVLGTVAAGAFMDSLYAEETHESDRPTIPMGRDVRYQDASQYALLVKGDSMNMRVQDGSYVTCANWYETGLSPKPGMVLHVERRRGGLTETTVKLLTTIDGVLMLAPESTNPAHKPFALDGNETDEIVICGIVTGSWTPFSY